MDKLTKLDEKDRKILAELDKDARQTDSKIAKKVRVSKQVANYRIQNLVNKKVIENFYTVINVGKLGLNSYYVFLQLENINKEQEITLLKKINNLDYVGWLVSGVGKWDAIILLYANSISTFDNMLNKVINICGNHLHEYSFSTLVEAAHISYKFLKHKEPSPVKQTEKAKSVELDKTDLKILGAISQKARASIVEISAKTRISLHVVSYHLKSLVKSKIIEGFKPKINISKLGYQWHLLLLQFQRAEDKRKQEFIDFCKSHNKVYYVTSTIGAYNLMLDLHVKGVEEFKEFLLDIKEKFSDVIKLYESMVLFDEYKINYLPKELIK